MAVAKVAYETLCNGMGVPEDDQWCIRDGVTGAHLRVWDGGHVGPYYAAWIDGPRHTGSGRYLAEVMCGEAVGGRLELL